MSGAEPLRGHTIRVASRRTGLSQHIIRVWERRYGAVTPQRTETNRRLYSNGDIERLQLLAQARRAGHTISRIAPLSDGELSQLVETERRYQPFENTRPRLRDADVRLGVCLKAVADLDAKGLEAELAQALVEMNVTAVLEDLIGPLMDEIGEQWRTGALRVANEHLASAAVRTFLGSVHELQRVDEAAPKIIVTTPARQLHEIGAVLAASAAAVAGWNVIYLGPNLPADEIAGAVTGSGVNIVALSVIYPADDPLMGRELLRLRRGVGDSVALLVGGRSASGYEAELNEAGAILLPDLESLSQRLETISASA